MSSNVYSGNAKKTKKNKKKTGFLTKTTPTCSGETHIVKILSRVITFALLWVWQKNISFVYIKRNILLLRLRFGRESCMLFNSVHQFPFDKEHTVKCWVTVKIFVVRCSRCHRSQKLSWRIYKDGSKQVHEKCLTDSKLMSSHQ